MKESISYTYLLNIIIIFILVAFMVLMGTLSYTKAFRVNSKIANAIEVCEGYNSCSKPEIERIIKNYGYENRVSSCSKKYGSSSTVGNGYCIYTFKDNQTYTVKVSNGGSYSSGGTYSSGGIYSSSGEYKTVGSKYYSYGVLTYMYIDIPVIGDLLKIPVYSETDQIYDFKD